MRSKWYQCPTVILPVLPQRRRDTHLPGWTEQPTQPLPRQHAGRPGRLTPGQWWRATGGRQGRTPGGQA
ncbi:hypothetical protein ACIBO1_12450 [Micromonospora sp. NPDC049903]|uniref:hypothetical protein n=1 Tax=Micromonospora sp. NPDC049903 TaxID=3364276 RepID=UPI0037B146AD